MNPDWNAFVYEIYVQSEAHRAKAREYEDQAMVRYHDQIADILAAFSLAMTKALYPHGRT